MQQMSDKIDNGQEYFNGVVPSRSNLMKKYVKERPSEDAHKTANRKHTVQNTPS